MKMTQFKMFTLEFVFSISLLLCSFESLYSDDQPISSPSNSPVIRTSLPTFESGTSFIRFEGTDALLQTPNQKEIRLSLGLESPRFLGALKAKQSGRPYFLFEGLPCTNCKMEKKLYLYRGLKTKPDLFTMPGKIIHPKNNATVYESRSFFGQCLAGYGDVLVSFQRENVDRRRGLRVSMFVAEPGEDHLVEKIQSRRMPSIQATLSRVKRGDCFEIPGKMRTVASRILDDVEKLKANPNDDGEEEDSAPPHAVGDFPVSEE